MQRANDVTRARRASGSRRSSQRRVDVMADILKVCRHIGNRLRQSMPICLKNNPAKFHPDSIQFEMTQP